MKSSAKTPNPLSLNPKSFKVKFSNHPRDFVANFSPSLFKSRPRDHGRAVLERDEAVSKLELQGLALWKKVKRKLGDDESYVGFLKMLSDRDMGFVELQMLVSDLVGGCPVIMKELDELLTACEKWELGTRHVYNRRL